MLATSVVTEPWPVERRVFVYDVFVKGRAVALLALPISQRAIFSFGGILNRLFTLTYPVR